MKNCWLLIYRIGNKQLSVGDLTRSGYYMGSNASYNLKKMISNGYIVQIPSPHDARSTYIALSADKGILFYQNFTKLLDSHAVKFAKIFSKEKFEKLIESFHNLEEFWQRLKLR